MDEIQSEETFLKRLETEETVILPVNGKDITFAAVYPQAFHSQEALLEAAQRTVENRYDGFRVVE